MDVTDPEGATALAQANVRCPTSFLMTGFTFQQNVSVKKFRQVKNKALTDFLKGAASFLGPIEAKVHQ